MATFPSRCAACTSTRPPGSLYLMPFSIRLVSSSRRRPGATATSALSPERLTLIFAASAICPSAARHSSATESTFARSSDWGMTTDSSSDIFSTSLMSSISRSTSTPIMVMKRF